MGQFKANLGNRVVLSRASSVTNHYQNGGAQGHFTEVFDSPEDPSDTQLRIYNIMTQLGNYTLPVSEATDRKLAVLGKLNYGIGGAGFEVDFDWKVGTQISVCASFVRVSAAYAEAETATTPPEVSVTAMMSSGSRAARSQVTRSYPKIVVVAEGGVALFPMPPLAHALYLFSEDPAFYEAGNVSVRFVAGASAGTTTATTDLVSFVTDGAIFLQALANEDGVRFPETARWVEVTNNSDEDDYSFTPCFTLSL